MKVYWSTYTMIVDGEDDRRMFSIWRMDELGQCFDICTFPLG